MKQPPSWWPCEDHGYFTGVLECRRSSCKQTLVFSGTYEVVEDYGDEGPSGYSHWYKPSIFRPSPALIDVPVETPEKLKKEVAAAFEAFWCDPSACLNRIRSSIEQLLTLLKVPQGKLVNKKRRRQTLGNRIDYLRRRRPAMASLCDRLDAVRHLGNAGSHPGKIELADVVDGFNILELLLRDQYSETHEDITKTVQQINRQKGPRKRPKA